MRFITVCLVGLMLAGVAAAEGKFEPGEGWISLFNGKDLAGLKTKGENNSWKAENGVLVNDVPKGKHGRNIYTEKTFKDFKLHIEFRVPKGGNSGVYLRGRKEIQVHDSHGIAKPGSGNCGGIYSKSAPSANPCKPAGEWNVFDVTIEGHAITVFFNGVKVQDKVVVEGHTGGSMGGELGTAGPIMLQGDHSAVDYRNMWIKPIEAVKK